MREALGLYAQIALLRRGPQDLPVSLLLLLLTMGGYTAVAALEYRLLLPGDSWPRQLAVEVLFTLGWYAAVLQLAGRRERYLQTVSGIFGVQLLLMPPLIAIAWLVRRPEQNSAWQLPLFMGGFGVVIWLIAAYGHVVKAALEWSSGSSVALVILQIVAAQLLLFALFPPGPGPA